MTVRVPTIKTGTPDREDMIVRDSQTMETVLVNPTMETGNPGLGAMTALVPIMKTALVNQIMGTANPGLVSPTTKTAPVNQAMKAARVIQTANLESTHLDRAATVAHSLRNAALQTVTTNLGAMNDRRLRGLRNRTMKGMLLRQMSPRSARILMRISRRGEYCPIDDLLWLNMALPSLPYAFLRLRSLLIIAVVKT
jgi:hypothetical protein